MRGSPLLVTVDIALCDCRTVVMRPNRVQRISGSLLKVSGRKLQSVTVRAFTIRSICSPVADFKTSGRPASGVQILDGVRLSGCQSELSLLC